MSQVLQTDLSEDEKITLEKVLSKKNKKKIYSFKYLFAIIVCFFGLLIKIFLIKTINYPEGGFLISTGTIMLSAWYGGFLPGLVAVFLNYLISDWFFITPQTLFFNDPLVDQLRFLLFMIEGILISWLFGSLHKSHQKTKDALYRIFLNQKLSRSLIENIKDYAIFMVDAKGHILTWNEGATIMTGYEIHDILGQSISLLFQDTSRGKNKFSACLQAAKAKGQYKDEGWKVRKGKSLFWAETVITALPNVFSYDQKFSVIIHDITLKKKIDELKSEFISIVSHELKTPISIMKIIVENNLRKYVTNKNLPINITDMKDIIGEVSRLEFLVHSILDITKLRTKRFFLHTQNIELNKLITKIKDKMQIISTRNLSINFNPSDNIIVCADEERIEQVVTALLDNAVKFTNPDGKIEIVTKISHSKAIVSIMNETNSSIPKEKYLLIFDKFYQLAKKPVKGLGLGLYISREIIKQHRGKMWVNSVNGKRNTFYFSLPLKKHP